MTAMETFRQHMRDRLTGSDRGRDLTYHSAFGRCQDLLLKAFLYRYGWARDIDLERLFVSMSMFIIWFAFAFSTLTNIVFVGNCAGFEAIRPGPQFCTFKQLYYDLIQNVLFRIFFHFPENVDAEFPEMFYLYFTHVMHCCVLFLPLRMSACRCVFFILK